LLFGFCSVAEMWIFLAKKATMAVFVAKPNCPKPILKVTKKIHSG